MKLLTYFAILCLFSASAFANDPRHETVVPASEVAIAPEVSPQMAKAVRQSIVRAHVQRYDRNGHVLVTDVRKIGKGNVAEEYTVKAVWTKN